MKIAHLFLGFVLLMSTVSPVQAKEIIVVIDPGHGGSDPGHESSNTDLLAEKDLNLKISMFLGGYMEQYLENVKVVYTRTDDTFPSLTARVDQANELNADYFISIHCNGNERKSVRGTETHVHSMSLTKSVELGKAIEKQFRTRAGRKTRGVKDKNDLQHSLQVLKYTNMTSVLVECGFMTNEKEAKYLNTTDGQEIIASAIFRAFRETIEKENPTMSFRKTTPADTAEGTTEDATNEKYGIQIASSKRPVDATKDPSMRKSGMTVDRKKLDTKSAYKYIYLVGTYSSRDDADVALEGLKQKGFKDAIVVKR
jgi:N-acetylmuramoyl-L-alanine amidase